MGKVITAQVIRADLTRDIAVSGKLVVANAPQLYSTESGISEHVIHQAILPFFSTKQRGTGVALAICKNVAEAHSGSLTLRNKDSGGLIASLSLPLTS